MKNLIHLLLLSLFSISLSAQSSHSLLRDGDKAYENQDFRSAEEGYRKALEKQPTFKGSYNLGNSVYSQSRMEEAIKHYQ